MSEEQTSPLPALRLKPRLRPAGEEPVSSSAGAGLPLSFASVSSAPFGATSLAASDAPPPPSADTNSPAAPGEAVKFRLKPKTSSGTDGASPPPPPPVLFVPDAGSPGGNSAPGSTALPANQLIPFPVVTSNGETVPAGVGTRKTLPPFPAIAPVRTGKTRPPLPAANVAGHTEGAADPGAPAKTHERAVSRARRPLIVLACVVAAGAIVFFGWDRFQAWRASKGKGGAAALVAAAANAAAGAPEAAKKIAQASTNAINKAQDAIASPRTAESARQNAIAAGEEIPDRPARKAPAASSASSPGSSTMTSVAPGLTAAAPIDAEIESSPAFRLYVANAKISGVFQGEPARVMLNGKLTRAGERVDAALGIVFDGLSADRHQLIFSDRTGAKVYRRF